MKLDYLEIRNQAHLMDFEGSRESERLSVETIKQAVKDRGYEPENVKCWWDDMFQRWNFKGGLVSIPVIDQYHTTDPCVFPEGPPTPVKSPQSQ